MSDTDLTMTLHNSVTRLRQQELAQSRRAFLARGGRVERCNDCLLSQQRCICHARPAAAGHVAVCLLYYKGEVFKPSNSGRLVADVLADNHAFLWSRTEPAAELLALLEHPGYAPVVVFPNEYAAPERCLDSATKLANFKDDAAQQGRKPLMILLDGTWREARKMFRSHWLSDFPVLGVSPAAASNYALREAAHSHQLGTAEVAIEILALLGDGERSIALEAYFRLFKQQYLAGKSVHGKSGYPSTDIA